MFDFIATHLELHAESIDTPSTFVAVLALGVATVTCTAFVEYVREAFRNSTSQN